MDAFFESSTSLVVLIFFIMSIGTASMLYKFLHKAVPGKVLVRTGLGGMLASFDSMIVLPVLHRLEVMDITQIIIKVERVGSDAVVFKGNVLADVKVSFYVRVNDSVDSALKAAQTLGGSRVSDEQELFKVFSPKFSESLTAAAKDLELSARDGFKRKIRGVVDTNLNGFIIDDVVVDYLEQRASE